MTHTKKQTLHAPPVRTTEEVLKDHLELSKHGTLEEDVKRKFFRRCGAALLLWCLPWTCGNDCVGTPPAQAGAAHAFHLQIPSHQKAKWAFWSGRRCRTYGSPARGRYLCVGNGLIVAQTIHSSWWKKKAKPLATVCVRFIWPH